MNINVPQEVQNNNKKGLIFTNYFFEFTNSKSSYNTCIKKIKEIKRDYRKKDFYIGATHDYEERFKEQMNDKKMYKMFLLTLIPTLNKSKKIEQKLIYRYRVNKHLKNKVLIDSNNNKIIIQGGGGEGLIHKKNYIYILLK